MTSVSAALLVFWLGAAFAEPLRIDHVFEPSTERVRLSLEDNHFTGHVDIDGSVALASTTLRLHSVNLRITHAAAWNGSTSSELSTAQDGDILILRSPSSFTKGRWTISIDYAGIPDGSGPTNSASPTSDFFEHGLFKRSINNETYFFTQLETIYARRVFPCIDEPDRKIAWQLTIDTPALDVAISNSELIRESRLDARRKRYEFARTSPIPSYLVGFAVGPFDVIDGGVAGSNVPIRLILPRGTSRKIHPLAKYVADTVTVFQRWIGVDFPYPKMDIVAVPNFWTAMENAGLVMIGESELRDVPSFATTVAHEVAHQWFGDMVTFSWWNDLWLAENLATWAVAASGLNGPHDEVRDNVEAARKRWRHPLRSIINTAQDLTHSGLFDHADYHHPALTLIATALGDEAFKRILQRYLIHHKHANANSDDLMIEISDTHGEIIASLASHYVTSEAPAEVVIGRSCSRSANELTVTRSGLGLPSVPVCFSWGDRHFRENACTVLKEGARVVTTSKCPDWILPAARGVGLYHSPLSESDSDRLIDSGWRWLTESERRYVVASTDEHHLLLRAALKLALSDDIKSVRLATDTLFALRTEIPNDVRGAFDAWVVNTFHGRFRGDQDKSVEKLLALAGAVDTSWREIARTYHTQPPDVLPTVLDVVADIDPAFVSVLLRDLPSLSKPGDELLEQTVIHALETSHLLIEVVSSSPTLLDNLQPYQKLEVLTYRCDPSERKTVIGLMPASRAVFDACLNRTSKIDREFRAVFSREKAN